MRQILCLFGQCLTLAVLLLLVRPAHAQRSASDKAAAEALFDDALQLMKEKRYSEACPKFEESQRVDAGIGTLLYLGECYEKVGRTASAWATFREAASAASAAGQVERARQGKERADRLQNKLSHLNITVSPANKALEGFSVTRAGQRVQAALFDTAVPVDPGTLAIEASAPGYEPFSTSVTVPANDSASVEIPPLVALPQPAAEPAAESSTSAAAASSSPAGASTTGNDMVAADAGTDDGSGMRVAGVVMLGVGAVGLTVGSIFGVRAINKDKEADAYCGSRVCTDEAGETLSDEALDAALISTIGFVAGGAAVLGGAALYLLAPDGSQTSQVEIGPVAGGAAVSYSGRF